SDYTSSTGQNFSRVEYLTEDKQVWAVMLIPKDVPSMWQPRGFIWIQAHIQNRKILCISGGKILIEDIECNPYNEEKIIYRGVVSDTFLRVGYEVVNKNIFK